MEKIKLKKIKNIEEFFKTINSCKGQVDLIGKDIRLNLKSTLTQYFSIAEIFTDDNMQELELAIYNANDAYKIAQLMSE